MGEVRQIEQAQDAVSRFEQRRGRNFTLVVRARFDAWWRASPLQQMPKDLVDGGVVRPSGAYLVPVAFDYLGLNDRFSVSASDTARHMHRRYTDLLEGRLLDPSCAGDACVLLGKARNVSREPLNSESALAMAAARYGVRPVRRRFEFCILSHRAPSYTPACMQDINRAYDGYKCQPCLASQLHAPPKAWPVGSAAAVQMYDALAPPDYVAARTRLSTRSETTCLSHLAALVSGVTPAGVQPTRSQLLEACRLAQARATGNSTRGCAFHVESGKWMCRTP